MVIILESLETAKQIKKVLEENNICLKPLNNLKKFYIIFMKKIILILIITFYSSLVFAAGSGGDLKAKTTASTGVKAATKFDIGKKWISKAKKFEKKNKQTLKLKMLMKKQ